MNFINSLLVQVGAVGATDQEVKDNMNASFGTYAANYGTRDVLGYSGHPISDIGSQFQRYFDFQLERVSGDPQGVVSIVNGVIE